MKFFKKTLIFTALIAAIFFKYSNTAYAYNVECSGKFSEDCDDCAVGSLRIGEHIKNLSISMTATHETLHVYEIGNEFPFKIKPFYKNGEIEMDSATPKNAVFKFNRENLFKDGRDRAYSKIDKGTKKILMSSKDGFFIKFARVSSEIKEDIETSGVLNPLFEYSYTLNYFNQKLDKSKVKSCVLIYPAFESKF